MFSNHTYKYVVIRCITKYDVHFVTKVNLMLKFTQKLTDTVNYACAII